MHVFDRLDSEEKLRQQQYLQNELEFQIKQQKLKEDELEARIAFLEDDHRSTMERVRQQQDRIRQLTDDQTALQATVQQDQERTASALVNISSNIRRLREETR